MTRLTEVFIQTHTTDKTLMSSFKSQRQNNAGDFMLSYRQKKETRSFIYIKIQVELLYADISLLMPRSVILRSCSSH